MPDVFVPLDTTENTVYHRSLVSKGVINAAAVEYLNKYRKRIKSEYPNLENFKKNYQVDDELIKLVIANGKADNIPFNDQEFKISERLLKVQLKSLLARDIWDVGAYFQVMETENEALQKAIGILRSQNMYNTILSGK